MVLTPCAFQLIMLVTNLSPLTQSDGIVTVEAATGSISLRGYSIFVLRCILMCRSLPSGLAAIRPAVRWDYFIYRLACFPPELVAFTMNTI